MKDNDILVIIELANFIVAGVYLLVAQTAMLFLIVLRLMLPEWRGGWLFLALAVWFVVRAVWQFRRGLR